jgi:hypothetical protein
MQKLKDLSLFSNLFFKFETLVGRSSPTRVGGLFTYSIPRGSQLYTLTDVDILCFKTK